MTEPAPTWSSPAVSLSDRAPERGDALVDLTVGGLLRTQARRHPDRVALVGTRHDGSAGRWTYGELLDESERVAGRLLELAEPGEHVALWAPNVAEWIIVQYGAALAGLVLVALNPALREPELEHALRLSRSTALLHADTSGSNDLAATAAAVAPRVGSIRSVVRLSRADELLGDPVGHEERSAPGRPAMMQFTSGTTGTPKGVLLRHRSLVNNARLTMLAAEVTEAPVAIAPLPAFHTAGCVISALGPATLGGTVVLIDRFEPGRVLEAIHDEHATVLMSVPTVLGAVLRAAEERGGDAPRLETVFVGAATAPGTMIDAVGRRFGAHVHNLYGQTELSPVLCVTRRRDHREDLLTAVGRPLPHVAVRIVDPVTGRTLPLGETGEICARGYNQMVEYFDDPAATANTVDDEGFLHTGDLGTMDERGMITLTGRLKDLIIRGGENIAPAEVEIALAAHPDVVEAAVIGLPDPEWGEIVAAVVVPTAPVRDEEASGDALAEHCLARLSPYKVPVRWFFRDELPHTPAGKVQKFTLRDELG
ncbi:MULTISPECIES: AMP-binding protein [unclassified Pseudonocardia]|uniref:class I adenylate-forming enzyme family protein n=1 Tax=unclassified Pseudonocardia TaxID=2619320 RepID=UPI0001FFDDF2|nr:AMP-binding protein [Pseudonocardia sp. Ae707_Ps1]OLM16778.1 Acetoacetyl-CoA synthetase / Long-chain-fatty-acid--CoA ligase [Pseudonocardia sp. Ae707_Ps1]